jgi:hypothetical protein
MTSEVARLQQQIRLEYEAGQRALHDFAQVSKHERITRHMENMEHSFGQLRALLPPDEAFRAFRGAVEGEIVVSHYEGNA